MPAVSPEPARGIQVPRALSIGGGAYALIAGLISFLGWLLGIPELTHWEGGGISIQPNACLLMVAAGTAVILLHLGRRRSVMILGAFVATAGLVNGLQYVVGRDFGFNDQLMFGHAYGQRANVTPGRFGPPASIAFMLIGVSLVLLRLPGLRGKPYPRARLCVPALGLIVCSLMLFSLAGYIFDARSFFAIPWLSAIALQTATMLMCLGAALVMSVPEHQPMRLLTSESGAGTMARRTLPVLVLLPPILIWIRGQGVELGWYDAGTGRALLVVSLVLITTALMWRTLVVVAEREVAEQAGNRYIEETLESLADGFVRFDAEWRFTYVNMQAEKMLMDRKLMLGRRWQDVFPAAIGTGIDDAMQRAMRERVPVELENYYEPWKRWFLVKLYPMDDGGITSIFTDVTLRKKMQEAIRNSEVHLADELARRTEQVTRAERALAQSERMAAVGTLASGLAHDINNISMPLGLRMERLLKNAALPDDIKDDLSAVSTLLDHLREMSRNLSLFSRDPDQEGTVGSTELASWWGGVEGLIASSLNASDRGRRRTYIHLKGDIPPGVPPVRVAPHRLTQAVLNLVHNARDAIFATHDDRAPSDERTEGHITIEARSADGEAAVTLRVVDDGCGMSTEVARRAIEPFFTTKDRTRATTSSGSGLGLALVQAICERSGGTLEIQSEPGRGSAITMILPVAKEAEIASSTGSADRPAE